MDDIEQAARAYRVHMMTNPPNRAHPHVNTIRALTHGKTWNLTTTPGAYTLARARGPEWHITFDDTGQFLEAAGWDQLITARAYPTHHPNPHQAALHAFLDTITKGRRP